MVSASVDADALVVERRLSPRARAGLDVARAGAALYVVLHHTVTVPGPFGTLFGFGQEAVLVFFLLSGFVIFANERDRSARPRGYYLRRLRRIYPPMIIAMLVSTVLWAIGLIKVDFTWGSLAGTLLALQDISFLKPGVVVDPYLGNDPLWSLSYEIFFYLVFPLVMIGWRRSAVATRWVVPAAAVIAYTSFLFAPNHFSLVASYFVMWWAGGIAAHLYVRGELHVSKALPEFVGLAALATAAGAGVVAYGFQGAGYFPFLILRHALAVLLLFALLFTPLRRLLASLALRVASPAALIAGVSYGLYVIHYPVMVQTGANSTWWILPATLFTVLLAWMADKLVPSLMPRAPRT